MTGMRHLSISRKARRVRLVASKRSDTSVAIAFKVAEQTILQAIDPAVDHERTPPLPG
ncbi:hypothetical protein D3C87_2210930 [compost metagenome]